MWDAGLELAAVADGKTEQQLESGGSTREGQYLWGSTMWCTKTGLAAVWEETVERLADGPRDKWSYVGAA